MFAQVSHNQVIVAIYVQPGAKQSQVVGLHGERLKVKISAPAQDGRANQAVINLFASICDLAKSQIQLVSGEKSRLKRIKLEGNPPQIIAQIEAAVAAVS